jgi:ferrochelatase
VWREDGSPLLSISRDQAAGLERILAERLPGPVTLALGMRYGQPSIPSALEALRRAGCRRLLVLPLYPQYSGSTTGSVFDAVADTLRRWRWVPELRFANHYHDEPAYIQALAASIREQWDTGGGPAERLQFSFHGVPKRYLLAGDPYHCQCLKTARLVAEALGLESSRWSVSFQSRVGREEWLRPYTDETMKALPGEGVASVDLISPGFSADCLETLEEIDEENRDYFLEAGGKQFRYIPCLNDRADHLTMLAGLVERHAAGWPETDSSRDYGRIEADAEATRERAIAAGAPR